jgi:hypothetical protein
MIGNLIFKKLNFLLPKLDRLLNNHSILFFQICLVFTLYNIGLICQIITESYNFSFGFSMFFIFFCFFRISPSLWLTSSTTAHTRTRSGPTRRTGGRNSFVRQEKLVRNYLVRKKLVRNCLVRKKLVRNCYWRKVTARFKENDG